MATRKQPSQPPALRAGGLVGQTIDDFEIVEEIGRGGMGIVFRARQISLDRFVAFKILSHTLGLTDHAVTRFQREARATAKLHHPCIIPIYAQGEQNQTYYYAMELVSGISLHDIIKGLRGEGDASPARTGGSSANFVADSSITPDVALAETRLLERGEHRAGRSGSQPVAGSLPRAPGSAARSGSGDDPRFAAYTPEYFDEIARQVRDVADALAYAHREGVIHRDIKPHNLLVGRSGNLCLTDFGLARVLAQPGMTQTGEFVGTPLYMAPEQITGQGDAHGVAADIYSLGATLYEWLTLSPPFPATTREQVISQIITSESLPPRARNRRVPVDLETICLKALDKEPARRYPSAADLRDDLTRFLNHTRIKAQRVGVLTSAVRTISRRRLAVTIGAAAVIIGALSLMLLRERRQSNNQASALDTTEVASNSVQPDSPELAEQPTPQGNLSELIANRMRMGEQLAQAIGSESVLSGILSTGDGKQYTPTTEAQRLSAAFLVAMRAEESERSDRDAPPLSEADEHFRRALNDTVAATALADVEECLRLEPERMDARLLRAWILCQLSQPQEMLKDAEAVVAAQPNDPQSLMARGAARLLLGDIDGAEQDITQAAQQSEGDFRAELLVGMVAVTAKQNDRALAAFGRALALKPDDVLALTRRAELNLAQGYASAALPDVSRVIELEPQNAEALGLRGACYDRMERFAEATQDYTRAYELSNSAAWVVKMAASMLNFEQRQQKSEKPADEGNAGTLEQDKIREQNRAPHVPPPADRGSVHHWWQRVLDGAALPREMARPLAPRLNANTR